MDLTCGHASVAARHQGRPAPRAFLSARDAGAHKEDALFLERFVRRTCPVEGIAAINYDVSLFEKRHQHVDDSSTGFPP